MASYGISSITTSGGLIQIDQNYQNFGLMVKGSVTCNNLYSARNYYYGEINVPYPNAILATAGTDNHCVFRTDGNATSSIRTILTRGIQTVPYYIFAPGELGSSEKYGLRILRPDGSLAYDSRYKYQKVLDFRTGNTQDPISGSYPGKTIAISQGILAFSNYYIPNGFEDYVDQYVSAGLYKVNGSNMGFETDIIGVAGPYRPGQITVPQYVNTSYNFLVLDVTNY